MGAKQGPGTLRVRGECTAQEQAPAPARETRVLRAQNVSGSHTGAPLPLVLSTIPSLSPLLTLGLSQVLMLAFAGRWGGVRRTTPYTCCLVPQGLVGQPRGLEEPHSRWDVQCLLGAGSQARRHRGTGLGLMSGCPSPGGEEGKRKLKSHGAARAYQP